MCAVENRWNRFLLIYGKQLGYVDGDEPTKEVYLAFVVFSFKTRERSSSSGKSGLGDGADLQHR